MQTKKFRVGQIDHVEVFVPDRHEAAKWYEQILGLEVVKAYEDWASAAGGPLMISSDRGATMLALFEGKPSGNRESTGHHRVAFRVDGAAFLEFLKRLKRSTIFDARSRRVTAQQVVDHGKSYSIYFCDPYGNRTEVTTYDYEEISHFFEFD